MVEPSKDGKIMKEQLNIIDQCCSELDRLKQEVTTQEHWLLNHAGVDSDMTQEVSMTINNTKRQMAAKRLEMLQAFANVAHEVKLIDEEMKNVIR